MTVFSGWGYTELCTLLEWLRVGTLLEWLLVGVIGSSVCELSQVMLSLLLETSKETQRGNARNDGSETVRGDCRTNTSLSHLSKLTFLRLLCMHSQIPHHSSHSLVPKKTSFQTCIPSCHDVWYPFCKRFIHRRKSLLNCWMSFIYFATNVE